MNTYTGYAPGRTTLNDHVDYWRGIGIGAALKSGTTVKFTPTNPAEQGAPSPDSLIIKDKRKGTFTCNINDKVSPAGKENGSSYVVGAFNFLRKYGLKDITGGKIEIESELPMGGGVSSSAALIVSTVNAALSRYFDADELANKPATYLLEKPSINTLVTNVLKEAGEELDNSHNTTQSHEYSQKLEAFFKNLDAKTGLRYINALLSYKVETGYMEKGCGRLDQMSCALADPGEALKINFDDLSFERLPKLPDSHSIIIVDSGQAHVIGEHGGGYHKRITSAIEEIMPFLGLKSILEIKDDDRFQEARVRVEERFGPEKAGWFEHAYQESRRGEEEAEAIKKGDMRKLAQLINDSHASLSGKYGTSTALIDELVHSVTAPQGPAEAARIVGGGNGGSVTLLAESAKAKGVCMKIDAFRKAKGALIQGEPHKSTGIKFLESPKDVLKSAGISADGQAIAA